MEHENWASAYNLLNVDFISLTVIAIELSGELLYL